MQEASKSRITPRAIARRGFVQDRTNSASAPTAKPILGCRSVIAHANPAYHGAGSKFALSGRLTLGAPSS